MKPKALMAWSSGKDCAWALHTARRQGEIEIIGLLTTITETYGRVTMHGVREELLELQAEAVGLPLRKVFIPTPCPNEVYEAIFEKILKEAMAEGVSHVVFGDLFLADLRAWRESQLARVGMKGLFPIWTPDTAALARRMIAAGVCATLTCVDSRQLAPEFAGADFDAALLDRLPPEIDPCGENGEFHTFAWDGPMFSRPVRVQKGETVEREGFIFTDLLSGFFIDSPGNSG